MARLTELQVIRALSRLERGWPSDLFLMAGDGGLHLMRLKDGDRLMEGDHLRQDNESIAMHFEGIKADGGDPW